VTADSSACLFCVSTPAAITRPDAVATLTAALARGDEQAFRKFHAEYAGRLLRYALTLTRGDFTLAEEAVQLALIRIAAKVRVFADDNALWAWLARITRSCVIDCARRHSRYTALLDRLRSEPAANPAPDEIERTFAEPLQAILATLDDADRAVLTEKYHEGVSTAELAARAGCTPKAMESRLARLRQSVRDLVLTRLRHET
jgi:RNA polymerase sigma factor (sigma-70 family)